MLRSLINLCGAFTEPAKIVSVLSHDSNLRNYFALKQAKSREPAYLTGMKDSEFRRRVAMSRPRPIGCLEK